MSDHIDQVELKLDPLTRFTRLVAGVAPMTAARVSLGVVLAVEDSLADPAGRLLGAKVSRGATGVVSRCGAFASSSRNRVSSKAKRPVSGSVPADDRSFEKVRGIVGHAASGILSSWRAAGYVTVVGGDADVPADELPEA